MLPDGGAPHYICRRCGGGGYSHCGAFHPHHVHRWTFRDLTDDIIPIINQIGKRKALTFRRFTPISGKFQAA